MQEDSVSVSKSIRSREQGSIASLSQCQRYWRDHTA